MCPLHGLPASLVRGAVPEKPMTAAKVSLKSVHRLSDSACVEGRDPFDRYRLRTRASCRPQLSTVGRRWPRSRQLCWVTRVRGRSMEDRTFATAEAMCAALVEVDVGKATETSARNFARTSAGRCAPALPRPKIGRAIERGSSGFGVVLDWSARPRRSPPARWKERDDSPR